MPLLTDVGVAGEAVVDRGLQAYNVVRGAGLVTFGFLWPKAAIWEPCDFGITTIYAACGATIMTSWTVCGAAPSTTWTACG